MNEDEELDIPIKDRTKQLELGICMECGKRKAKYLCDFIIGKSFDLYLSLIHISEPTRP